MKACIAPVSLLSLVATLGMPLPATGALITLPADGPVWLLAEGGWAGAHTDVGVGPRSNPGPTLLIGLPHSGAAVVSLGVMAAGTGIDVWLSTPWGSLLYQAFSSDLGDPTPSFSTLEVFRDRNGSMGLGGSCVVQLGPQDWRLYLDDAASSDDDDEDVILRITQSLNPPNGPFDPPPPPHGGTSGGGLPDAPSSVALLLSGCIAIRGLRSRIASRRSCSQVRLEF